MDGCLVGRVEGAARRWRRGVWAGDAANCNQPNRPSTLPPQDTFDPKEFGQQSTQRMATVLVYLSGEAFGGKMGWVWGREGLRGDGGMIGEMLRGLE
jgi:hypothetical protein